MVHRPTPEARAVIQLDERTACTVPPDAPPPRRGETPWFPGRLQPVMDGVYRRLSVSGATLYSWWDSVRALWLWNATSPARAAANDEPSLIQTLPWCGLAEPPEGGYGPSWHRPPVTLAAGASDSEGGEPC